MGRIDQTFKYDELNRLTEAMGQGYGTKSYVYDAIGNIVQKDGKTYFYGDGVTAGPHAVTSLSDGTTFGYDANGNMLTKVEAAVTTNYKYDSENRLIEVKKGGSIIGQYTYDGDGGRTTKVATVSGQTTTTTFVGSLFETSGSRTTKFIFLGGQRVAAVTNSPSIGSTTLYYHADHLGGANVLTDSTGFKKELIEYEPFGLESRHEKYGSSEEVAWYYFTGKKTDDESGLIYFGARYYDPSLGRFITPDLLIPRPGDPQSFNRYAYAGNNPVNRTDGSGHGWFKKFWGQLVSAVVGITAFVASGFNPVIGMQAYSITNSVISGAQAIAAGGNPLRILGSVAVGMAIGLGTADFIGGIGNLGLRIGAFAVQGATIGAAGSAIMGGDIGMGAAWGAGMGATMGFLSSQQMTNYRNHRQFMSDKNFARFNQKISDMAGSLNNQGSLYDFEILSGEGQISSIGAGHTGMSLNGDVFGFRMAEDISYTRLVLGGTTRGAVTPEQAGFAESVRYNGGSYSTKVNSFQANVIQMQRMNPGTFALSTNCSHFALDTARFIGINVPSNLTTFGMTNPSRVAAWSRSVSSWSADK